MFETPELWDPCQGDLQTGSGSSPGEKSVLQPEKLGAKSPLSPSASDMELQDFGVCPARFWSCVDPVFSPRTPILPFRGIH